MNEMVEKMLEDLKKTGAMISALKMEREELSKKLEQAIKAWDRAKAAIPHTCFYCSRGLHTEEGFDCNESHYRGEDNVCLNWRWRGEDEVREESLRKRGEDVVCIGIRDCDDIPLYLVYESIAEVLKTWWDEEYTDIPAGDAPVLKVSISGKEIIPPKTFGDLICELEQRYWKNFGI